MSRNKHKNSSGVAGTAKCQTITVETKVKTIERVEQGKKTVDVTHSYKLFNHEQNSKEQRQSHRPCEVWFANDVHNNVKEAWRSDGGDGETLHCIDAGSASALSPTQLNAEWRES